MFSLKGAKNIPINSVDDKRQITATFAVSCTGEFQPIQTSFSFPCINQLCRKNQTKSSQVFFFTFFFGNVTRKSLVKHRSLLNFLKKIFFLEKTKRSKSYPLEQHALIIMDTFKRQENDTLKKFCADNKCDDVIVPLNLTNKFQPLDLSVNKAAKSFFKNKYNDWFSDQHLRSFKMEKTLLMLKYHPNYRI